MFDDYINELMYLMRILIAAVLGLLIGIERKMRLKEAGMRTHSIVSIGACLMMLISKYGFKDIGSYDASRIAAQVVSGIGFLGAGMIIYKRDSLRGLTTAAGVWATAGIGMCVGSGLYIVSFGATIIIVFLQFILHYKFRLFENKEYQHIRVVFESSEQNIQKIKEIFSVDKFYRTKNSRDDDKIIIMAEIISRMHSTDEYLSSILQEHSFIKSVERTMEE